MRPAPLTISGNAVLDAHFTLVDIPGAIELVVLSGARGWKSPNPHPVLNLMQWTTKDPIQAAADLDTVQAGFQETLRGFDWMTGPRCAEAGLPELLAERGFISPALPVAAMAKELSPGTELPIMDVPGYRIRKELDDERQVWRVMAQGFDVPEEVGHSYHRAYLTGSEQQRTEVFMAERSDSGEVAAVGYLSWIGDGTTVLLRVSATAEGHRGKGLYRALVIARLAEAARRGARRAFVHAYSEHSKRALADLGFCEVGRLELHRWRP